MTAKPLDEMVIQHFFKKAWAVVGNDVCLAVKKIFKYGKLLKEINSTLITLIPKVHHPKLVTEFRPIACCNVLYKCISKVLTNRIKETLNKLVNLNQSAFIHGRNIQDNILLTQELLKNYNRKGGAKRCALKIDIAKAYDTVSWEFLRNALIKFGFHRRMVDWIYTCISSTTFSICVNGESNGYFKGGRGLRQGDPISPYLFTLVMEVFTLIMAKKVENSTEFKYHTGCKELKLTHLCFADDLLVICHGSVGSINVIKESIDEFSKVSGLEPNLNKIPLITKRLGREECKQLIDKVKNKVKDWKNKVLSYAGRMHLIDSILNSMQVYWASVFLLPKSTVKDIERVLKGFLWCQGDLSRGKAKIAWKTLCKPKCQGGFGFKELGMWNEVLLTRHIWNIAANKESLWVKWVHIVKLKGKNFWEVSSESNDSWMWKCLLGLREKAKHHIEYIVENGKRISVWYDKWNEMGALCQIIDSRNLYNARYDKKATVADMIHNNQ
ncbi:RNA-directed DNA polymerase, eukaryota, reverse transcriptase zinc-binding domain protein [Tanacetum coccineum]|uniref:RNA-directed DNA polymerase, eukaryota, reverse transcriptase zinc-binding domain protein n=1 Tax=Tanacetum coccineum TaxID=301880 RepID=A0ABQ5IUR1_9ASTR